MKIKKHQTLLNDNISDVICKINIEEFEINNTKFFSICYFVGRIKQIQNGPKVSQIILTFVKASMNMQINAF